MFSHITVGVSDLETAGRFYDAVLSPLGLINRPVIPDGGPASLCWIHPDHNLPRFYTYLPFNGAAATAGNGSMVAFLAPRLMPSIKPFRLHYLWVAVLKVSRDCAKITVITIMVPISEIRTVIKFISSAGMIKGQILSLSC